MSEDDTEAKAVEAHHAFIDRRAIERMLDGKIPAEKVKGLLEAAAKYEQTRSEAIKRQIETRTTALLDIRKNEGDIEERRDARRFKSLLVLVVLTVLVTASAVALLVLNVVVAGSVMVAFAGVGLGGCLVLAPGSPMEPKDVQKLAETMAKMVALSTDGPFSASNVKSLPPPPSSK